MDTEDGVVNLEEAPKSKKLFRLGVYWYSADGMCFTSLAECIKHEQQEVIWNAVEATVKGVN